MLIDQQDLPIKPSDFFLVWKYINLKLQFPMAYTLDANFAAHIKPNQDKKIISKELIHNCD